VGDTAPIDTAVARLREISAQIEARRGPKDGVLSFNRLYLAVTEAVGTAAAQPGFFTDALLMARFDELFAGRYFLAIDADAAGNGVPDAWQALFHARSDPRVSGLQFALAGMNAHINHDLPLALLDLWEQVDPAAHDSAGFRSDYDAINRLLGAEIDREKASLHSRLVEGIDDAVGKVDDAVASWSLDDARAHAWDAARTLWHLRAAHMATDAVEGLLDRLVGTVGAGLLTPLR
jgi:hypothetical protein